MIYKAAIFTAMMALMLNIQAQEINRIMLDTNIQKDILIGECNREGLMLPVFAEYYNRQYAAYAPDPECIPQLAARGTEYRIWIFMGSWCSDSQEQVPRFLKIADSFGFPETSITIFCLDRKKFCEGIGDIVALTNITLVPTFVFYQGEKEIGRITETPMETLEKDWLKILENL